MGTSMMNGSAVSTFQSSCRSPYYNLWCDAQKRNQSCIILGLSCMTNLPPFPSLIIVDVQNDYVLASGALPCPDAPAIIPHIHSAAHSGFYSAGIYLSADDKAPAVEGTRSESGACRWPPHCITGSFGAQIHAGLCHNELPGAVIITKRSSMSAFGSVANGETTNLHLQLLLRAPSHAVVCGLALECAALPCFIELQRLTLGQVLCDGDSS